MAASDLVGNQVHKKLISDLREDMKALAEEVKVISEKLAVYYPADRGPRIGFVTRKFNKLNVYTKQESPVANLVLLSDEIAGYIDIQLDAVEFHKQPELVVPLDEQVATRTGKWEHLNNLRIIDEIIQRHTPKLEKVKDAEDTSAS